MVTISILANTVRPSVDRRSDDTTFRVETFSLQDPVHFLKAGPGEVMTGKFIKIESSIRTGDMGQPNILVPLIRRGRHRVESGNIIPGDLKKKFSILLPSCLALTVSRSNAHC